MTSEDSPTEYIDPATINITTAETCWDHFEAHESLLCDALSKCRNEALTAALWWAQTMSGSGRIIGLGAGTSGRLIALEMAEWGPTFSIADDRRKALIAGGTVALTKAVEGAEDDGAAGCRAIDEEQVGEDDLVLGVSASGLAAFVRDGLSHAAGRGARCILVTANPACSLPDTEKNLRLLLETGSETVAGSTRLGAATATHRLLHRISTMGAQRLGWIYRGRMVRMQVTNEKLHRRAVSMVSELTELSKSDSECLISRSGNDLRLAIVAGWLGESINFAREVLNAANGRLSAFEEHLERFRSDQIDSEELADLLRKP